MNKREYSFPEKYKLEVIDQMSKFEKLEPLWNSFLKKGDGYGYFLSFEWYKLWLEHFLKNDKLNILLLFEDNQVVTIAPFLIIKEKYKKISINKMVLIGNAYSPVRNILFKECDSISKKHMLSYLFDHLMYSSNHWDLIELYPLREDDMNYLLIKEVIKEKGYLNREKQNTENFYENNFPSSFDEYLNRRSKQFRKQLRRLRKKLEELGRVEIMIIQDSHNIDKWLNCYYEVYSKSWKKRESIGPTFHRDLAKMAAQSNNLRLGLLLLNNKPIAAEYCVIYNRTAHFLKAAYDEEYSFYMPGNIIYYEVIKYLVENDNIRAIDLGPGSDEYKKSLASEKRSLKQIFIFGKTMKGRIIAMVETVVVPGYKKCKGLKKLLKVNYARV